MIRPIYSDFTTIRPERPLRALPNHHITVPALYNAADQLALLENALVEQRLELQVEMSMSQLAKGVRNAEDFVEKHILAPGKVRPSIHALWFHTAGLHRQTHVMSNLATHHLVPIASLLSVDFAHQKMDIVQAKEVYEAMCDATVASSAITRRELHNQMIRCYALDNKPEEALQIIRDMKSHGIRRTFVTYAPLFRLARQSGDVELHERVSVTLLECEGGRLSKWMFIDTPRIVHVGWVAVRFYWPQLTVGIGCFVGIVFSYVTTTIGVL